MVNAPGDEVLKIRLIGADELYDGQEGSRPFAIREHIVSQKKPYVQNRPLAFIANLPNPAFQPE